VLAVIGAVALVELVVGVAVFATNGKAKTPGLALPQHPVAGAFKPDRTQLAECSESDQRCIEQAFGNIAYYRGPKAVRPIFDARFGSGADPVCHRVAHIIGAASLVRFKGNVARTFAAGWADCFSGYYHGVLERALVTTGYSQASMASVARRLCSDPSVREVKWLAYQCLHGLGHGLMITTGYDLPRALKVCGALITKWDRQACNGGVFMENMSSSYGFTSRWLRDDDLLYPCDAVAPKVKLTCYQLITSRILAKTNWDWDKTAALCGGAERGWRAACFQSYGRDASGYTARNPDAILDLCAKTEQYGGNRTCILFAAMDMTANFNRGKEAAVLCDKADSSLREPCYFAIGQISGRFTSSDLARRRDCEHDSTVSRYVAACIRGATGKDFAGVTGTR
jgi:hypothetical protein